MKRFVCLALSVLMLLALFTACNAKPKGPSGEIRIVWWGGDARHEKTLAAIDLFEKAYPDIKVNPEYMGSDTYWDKLATQVAGGTAPDVIQFGGNYPDYVAKDALLNLNSYKGGLLNLNDFDKDVLEIGSQNGNLYGVCLGTNALCLVYNKTILEAAGAPLPTDMSWDELDAYLASIKDKLPEGVFPMTDNSCNQSNYLGYFMRQNGTPIYRDGASQMTAEAATKWIDLWEGYRANGYIPGAELSASYAETAADSSIFVAGKTCITLIWSNQVGTYQGAMTDEIGVMMLPSGAGNGAWIQPSQYMCVNSKSKNIDAAVTFINFFVNDPEVGKILGNDRGISSNSKVREAIKATANATDQQIYDFYARVTKVTLPMDPNLPNDQEFNNTLKTICQEVSFGQTTPAQGGQKLFDLVQTLIKK